jgi:hypothetical protein
MESQQKKTINHYMRALHRDLGFFTIGLMVMYALSGLVLIYRDTGFMKVNTRVEKMLTPNMEPPEIGQMLHMRDFKVTRTDGETIYFEEGSYNKTTGVAIYTTKENPFPISKFNKLHMSSSRSTVHWFTTIFGLILLFLAISSFWMFKKGTKLFRRGMYIAAAGIVFAVALLFF